MADPLGVSRDAGPDDQVWYFAYANFMKEDVFHGVIGQPPSAETVHVVAEDAWLSFDYCGIPFVEPAYPSLIIRGFNDKLPNNSSSQNDDSVYLRYIHDRCFPGIPFTPPGELPPPVEVQCKRLDDAKLESSRSNGQIFTAYCLVAKDKYRSSCMMPTITSYASVYRGALTHGFSLQYMRHLSQLRPYNLAYATTGVRIAKQLFIGLILGPQFALFYLPLVAAQRVLGGTGSEPLDRLKLLVSDFIRYNAIVAERYLFRPFVGRAGYVIDY